MPTVIVYGAQPKPGRQVFVSLEHIPLVLAEVRAALPQLEKELKQRWPVKGVEIENRRLRLRNPIDPALTARVIARAAVGIAIIFGAAAVTAAGTRIGAAVADEIVEYARGWLKRLPHRRTVQGSSFPPASLRMPCECGCGEYPKSAKSRFLPGHDLRKAYDESRTNFRRGAAKARGKR